MDHTILKARKKQIVALGVEVFDTHFFFMELTPSDDQNQNTLTPSSWGRVGITFDAVEKGRIINKTRVLESIKKIRSQTKSTHVVIASLGSKEFDAQWKELFIVGGFNSVEVISREQSMRTYTDSEHLIPAYFVSENAVTIAHNVEGISQNFSYPLDVNGILDLQELLGSSTDAQLSLAGHFVGSAQDISETFFDYALPVKMANVWRKCFSLDSYIPQMVKEDSYAYATTIALAYCGSRYLFEEQLHETQSGDNQIAQKETTLKEQLTPRSEEMVKEISKPDTSADDNTPPEITKFLPKNKKLQKLVFKKPMIIEQSGKKAKKQIEKQEQNLKDAQQKKEKVSVKPAVEKKKSVWLSNVDDMIYSMFGKHTDPK